MRTLVQIMRSFPRREEGQTLTEYGLLLALIAVVVIGVVTLLGGKIVTIFQSVIDGLT